MSVWTMPEVSIEPKIWLSRWQVLRCVAGDVTGDVLIGRDVANDCGRLSTAVVSFRADDQTVTTASGRLYVLEGAPGFDDDAWYVFQSRAGTTIPDGCQLINVSAEYWASIKGSLGETP